ncbi:uncharacterized protein DS421_10g294780 [Arachis hypogaea]|nr:uncharacterized protein DS421_10g294780 [Arachis hypogaea]
MAEFDDPTCSPCSAHEHGLRHRRLSLLVRMKSFLNRPRLHILEVPLYRPPLMNFG